MKDYKKIIIITIVIFFTAVFGWWIVFRYLPCQLGATINEEQIKSNIISIVKRNTNDVFAVCRILTSTEKLEIVEKNNENFFENMSENERIVYIRGGDGLTKNMNPIQIYAIYESWLFIQNKSLPYDIIAISCPYTSGGIDNTNGQITTITKPEFEEIYNVTDIKGFTKEQAAKALADKWIQKTGYVKK